MYPAITWTNAAQLLIWQPISMTSESKQHYLCKMAAILWQPTYLVGVKRDTHDDVIKWKHFTRYWPFVRGIHRSPVNYPHKCQWRGALMFSLIWPNKRLSKQWWGWWFETTSSPLWRHCNVSSAECTGNAWYFIVFKITNIYNAINQHS